MLYDSRGRCRVAPTVSPAGAEGIVEERAHVVQVVERPEAVDDPDPEPGAQERSVAAAPGERLGRLAEQPGDVVASVVVDDQESATRVGRARPRDDLVGDRPAQGRPQPDDHVGGAGRRVPGAVGVRGAGRTRAPRSASCAARRSRRRRRAGPRRDPATGPSASSARGILPSGSRAPGESGRERGVEGKGKVCHQAGSIGWTLRSDGMLERIGAMPGGIRLFLVYAAAHPRRDRPQPALRRRRGHRRADQPAGRPGDGPAGLHDLHHDPRPAAQAGRARSGPRVWPACSSRPSSSWPPARSIRPPRSSSRRSGCSCSAACSGPRSGPTSPSPEPRPTRTRIRPRRYPHADAALVAVGAGARPGDPSTAPRHHRVEQGIPPAPARRRPRRPRPPGTTSRPPSTSGSSPSSPVSTSPTGSVRVGPTRCGRGPTAGAKPSFLERNRNLLVGIAVIAIVALAGIGMFAAASQPVFACSNVWQPDRHADAGRGRLAAARLRPAGHGPDPHRQRHDRDLHLLPAGQRSPLQRRRRRPDRAAPVRPGGPGQPAGLDPQPGARRPCPPLPRRQRRRDRSGPGRSSGRSSTTIRRARCAASRPVPASGRCSPASTRWPRRSPPSCGVACCPLEELDEAAIIEFDATFGERTNPEQFCTPPSASPAASAAPSGSAASGRLAERRRRLDRAVPERQLGRRPDAHPCLPGPVRRRSLRRRGRRPAADRSRPRAAGRAR